MPMQEIHPTRHSTRRGFGLLMGSALASASAAVAQSSSPVTAVQIIDRIQKNVGVSWQSTTVDTFKAGNPETRVRGIATSVMSTLDVLHRAAASGKNLIISHEPTFYNHQDDKKELLSDPVFLNKQKFIEKNDMVIWRFHDHWHARKPDAMLTGIAQVLGWEKYQSGPSARLYDLPGMTLDDVASAAQKRFKARAIRVIGDPKTLIRKAALNPGFTSLQAVLHTMPQVDLFVVGEPREWEGVEYVQDAVSAGEAKAMIILGHAVSEDPGMRLCADWVKGFVPEVPVEWIPAGEPFWRPSAG